MGKLFWEIVDRTMTGPLMKEDDFENEFFPAKIAEIVAKHKIEFDPAEPFRHLAKVDGGYPVLVIDLHRLHHGPRLLSAEASPQTVENLVKVRSIHRDAEPGGTVLTPWE